MTVTLRGSDWFSANTGLQISPAGGGALIFCTCNFSEGDVGTHGAVGGSGATWGSVVQTKPSVAHAQAIAVATTYNSGANAVTVTPAWGGPQVVGVGIWEVHGVGTVTPLTPVAANGAASPATVGLGGSAGIAVAMASNYDSASSPATHDWSGAGYTEDRTDLTEDISGATVGILSGGYDDASPGAPSAVLTGTFNSWCITAVGMNAGTPATLDQEAYRWYDDDSDPSTSTALEAQDTAVSGRATGTPTLLRVRIQATENPNSIIPVLQWKVVGDPVSEWEDLA